MKQEYADEIVRRANIIFENKEHNHPIATGSTGSSICYNIALSILGYPYKIPMVGMTEAEMTPIMTEEEYHSGEYDTLIDSLHDKIYKSRKRKIIYTNC